MRDLGEGSAVGTVRGGSDLGPALRTMFESLDMKAGKFVGERVTTAHGLVIVWTEIGGGAWLWIP